MSESIPMLLWEVEHAIAQERGLQIERMAQTILNYRFIVQDLEFADELIADAERKLTAEERELIG